MVELSRDRRLVELELRLEQLRHHFDQFFLGHIRRPPTTEQQQIARQLRKEVSQSQGWPTRNRFKIKQLMQRFTTYNTMWQRQLTAKENGTHRIDKARYKRKTSYEDHLTQQYKRPVEETPTAPSTSTDYQAILDAYLASRQKLGRPSRMTLDRLQKQLEDRIPEFKKKFGGEDVGFKVVVKDGDTMIKPVPLKELKNDVPT